MKCPVCGNNYCKMISSSEVSGNDYSICWGLIGEMLFGSSGFLCGFTDDREKKVDAYWVCTKCGKKFKA